VTNLKRDIVTTLLPLLFQHLLPTSTRKLSDVILTQAHIPKTNLSITFDWKGSVVTVNGIECDVPSLPEKIQVGRRDIERLYDTLLPKIPRPTPTDYHQTLFTFFEELFSVTHCASFFTLHLTFRPDFMPALSWDCHELNPQGEQQWLKTRTHLLHWNQVDEPLLWDPAEEKQFIHRCHYDFKDHITAYRNGPFSDALLKRLPEEMFRRWRCNLYPIAAIHLLPGSGHGYDPGLGIMIRTPDGLVVLEANPLLFTTGLSFQVLGDQTGRYTYREIITPNAAMRLMTNPNWRPVLPTELSLDAAVSQ
jgi:hypothetical protein